MILEYIISGIFFLLCYSTAFMLLCIAVMTYHIITINREYFTLVRDHISEKEILDVVSLVGRPKLNYFQPSVACVWFDMKGNFLALGINPLLWNRFDKYQKLFIIFHEVLHIIRKDVGPVDIIPGRMELLYTNIAQDIIINHTLCEKYGFKRELVDPDNLIYWLDNTFPKRPDLKLVDKYELYYNLLCYFDEDYNDPNTLKI